MEDAINIGKYSIPWILSILLAFIYSQVYLTDKLKNLIAVLTGVGLGIISIWVAQTTEPWTPANVLEHVLYGVNAGLASVGFWKTLNIQFRPELITK